MNFNNDDPQYDPIVEILRLAYRRGLALRREQEQHNSTIPENCDAGVEKITNHPTPTKSKE